MHVPPDQASLAIKVLEQVLGSKAHFAVIVRTPGTREVSIFGNVDTANVRELTQTAARVTKTRPKHMVDLKGSQRRN